MSSPSSMTKDEGNDENLAVGDAATRILKRGDLARVNSKTQGKIKDHDGDLGRIVRVTSVGPTLENSHPYVYDLDLVLGGKLNGVFRADLLYTTATQEGMTGDSRRRRKRKTSLPDDADDEPEKKSKTNAAKKKKVAEKSKPTVKKTKAAAKAPATKSTAGRKKAAEPKVKVKDTPTASAVTMPPVAVDLYERHQRDFEKALNRLEKSDAYNFFGSEVPPEFQETYEIPSQENGSEPVSSNENGQSNEIKADAAIPDSQTSSKHDETRSAQHEDLKVQSQSPNDISQDGPFFPDTPPYNLVVVRQRMKHGRYITDRVRLENDERIDLLTPYFKSIGRKNIRRRPKTSPIAVLNKTGVNWELFRKDVEGMCDTAVARNEELGDKGPGTLFHTAQKIKELLRQLYERFGVRHNAEMAAANDRHRFVLAMEKGGNSEAAMQGKWKRDAFAEREYEKLQEDAVCSGLSPLDERIATYELKTTLKDSFIGLAYTYDDTGQSEGWMKSALGAAGEKSRQLSRALASDDGVIKAQVEATMQKLIIGVQDKVMTQAGVLEQKELRSANWGYDTEKVAEQVVSSNGVGSESGPEIVEQPVWGIDCYTRKNISLCLESEFDADIILTFVVKWLLPAINACPADLAYDLSNALRILEGLPFDTSTSLDIDNSTTTEQWKTTLLGKALLNKISKSGPPWLHAMSNILRRAKDSLGPDFFRVHPKGHGSVVLCDKLAPNRLVTFYRGEVYPSWRWGEKIDAIAAVQKRKGLKPVLPDFFNMALERPQKDPRGYGLLFVDASRRSGYGSMLSHSCEPSCEVVCVAANGELRLAMTTIREISLGDELTFDYNAVTESLIEYQGAVCLCGHGKCRGSFLHFATAECYQQVLHRNAPVAVRLANLIKGSAKKVLSEDDDTILKKHGFQTAVFGAVSVNRRKADILDRINPNLDSMDIVPIWLRTYVATLLRYIEYERCALPIALLCNDLDDAAAGEGQPESRDKTSQKKDYSVSRSDDDEKPIKGSKPEPTFFYYSRKKREQFVSLLMQDEENKKLSGIDLKREVQKLASNHWKELDPQQKERWKKKAAKDWERNGGKEKAQLEEQRMKRLANKGSTKGKKEPRIGQASEAKEKSDRVQALNQTKTKPKISFQQADAEGLSAMEQRIQQLTQTLSRVGRVLDRHREAILESEEEGFSVLDDKLREVVHSPLVVMPDEEVIAWMWNHDSGIVRTLLSHAANEPCVSPALYESLKETVSKFSVLEKFGCPWEKAVDRRSFPMGAVEARTQLNVALMELREVLLDGIQDMASNIKKQKASAKKAASRKKEEIESAIPSQKGVDSEITAVMESLILSVEARVADSFNSADLMSTQNSSEETNSNTPETSSQLAPCLQQFNKRFKLEKAADVLLMYANTGNFFKIQAYRPLKSSPLKVYARELGRTVPTTAIDKEVVGEAFAAPPSEGRPETEKAPRRGKKKICDPEDVISNVAVEYQGDFVLSQLLQWYNAGIGQKPGLPDILGCILLPHMKGCWTVDSTSVSNSHTDRATKYQSSIRRKLIGWLKDPVKRGSPWPDDIRKEFLAKEDDGLIGDATSTWLPLGSPILDLLVTGDDYNLNSVVKTMASFHSSISSKGSKEAKGLLSTVDEGRPAQAVSNWIQCENPECQKWRKVPWNIDIDMLSEQFYCKDNVWNPASASCDAPEDEWDEAAEAQVGADGSAIRAPAVASSSDEENDMKEPSANPGFKLTDFKLGARFDVLREEKGIWAVGTIVKVDLSGPSKRVKIHYSKMQIKHDEWVEIDSGRIAILHSKVKKAEKKAQRKKGSARKSKSVKSEDADAQKVAASKPSSVDENPETGIESNVSAEDSSMADVFLQDSDDESVDAAGKGSIQPSREKNTGDVDDVLKDSDDESSEPPTKRNDKTDDSSDTKTSQKSSWTIPKKSRSLEGQARLKEEILNSTAMSSPEKVKKTTDVPIDRNAVNRIPRKKVDTPSGSLLKIEQKQKVEESPTKGNRRQMAGPTLVGNTRPDTSADRGRNREDRMSNGTGSYEGGGQRSVGGQVDHGPSSGANVVHSDRRERDDQSSETRYNQSPSKRSTPQSIQRAYDRNGRQHREYDSGRKHFERHENDPSRRPRFDEYRRQLDFEGDRDRDYGYGRPNSVEYQRRRPAESNYDRPYDRSGNEQSRYLSDSREVDYNRRNGEAEEYRNGYSRPIEHGSGRAYDDGYDRFGNTGPPRHDNYDYSEPRASVHERGWDDHFESSGYRDRYDTNARDYEYNENQRHDGYAREYDDYSRDWYEGGYNDERRHSRRDRDRDRDRDRERSSPRHKERKRRRRDRDRDLESPRRRKHKDSSHSSPRNKENDTSPRRVDSIAPLDTNVKQS